MIIAAPRFIAVDDNKEHLRAITDTLSQLGAPCIGIHYDPSNDIRSDFFRGVRCLFMDLHLIDSAKGSDNKRHYAVVTSLLEDNIGEQSGPYILIVWTEHEHLSAGLKDYIYEHIDEEKKHAIPLAVLALDKTKFINTEDGTVKDAESLRSAVFETVASSPQLAAILNWESDILSATSSTLASIIDLIPTLTRKSTEFGPELDKLLSMLASEAVGKNHVVEDRKAAVYSALFPILSDRILNLNSDSLDELWAKAITKYSGSHDFDINTIGSINRMMHISLLEYEKFCPTDWGVIVHWPYEWSKNELKNKTGFTINELLCNDFCIKKESIPICTPVLVRIGASCDYAQNKKGPLIYLFGLFVPDNVEWVKIDEEIKKMPEAIWKSPTFKMPRTEEPKIEEPGCFYVHMRLPFSVLPEEASSWKPYCRIREQLMTHLITLTGQYATRPGFVSVR